METPRSIPSFRHYLGEARIGLDWVQGRLAEDRLAAQHPGDGQTVIILPGFMTSDTRTRMLRRVLRKAGYRAHGWALGRNLPIKPDILDRLDVRVSALATRNGDRATLVGWSLGGIVARAYALQSPDRVAGVITLGSPFSGHPRNNRAWPLYELLADHRVDAPPIADPRGVKPPVPTTAIWSSRDGIIWDGAARGEPHERDAEIEVRCGHFALTCAPDAIKAVLVALADQRSNSATRS